MEAVARVDPLAGLTLEPVTELVGRSAAPPFLGVDLGESASGFLQGVPVGPQCPQGGCDGGDVAGHEGFRVVGLPEFGGHQSAAGSAPVER